MLIEIDLTVVIVTAIICIAVVVVYGKYTWYSLIKDRRKMEQIIAKQINAGNAYEEVEDVL